MLKPATLFFIMATPPLDPKEPNKYSANLPEVAKLSPQMAANYIKKKFAEKYELTPEIEEVIEGSVLAGLAVGNDFYKFRHIRI